MRVLIVPFGSAGDVHPFVGIGLALRERGHDVTFLTIPDFGPLVDHHGFASVVYGDPDRYTKTLQDPRLWHPTKSLAVITRSVIDGLRPVYEEIAERYVPGETVVVAGSLAMGARVAQESLGVPLATVHLSPSIFRTVHDTPILGGFRMPRWMPPFGKRGLYRLMDWMVDLQMVRDLNLFRAELGLRPISRVMADWWNSPECILAMFPEWFAPRQPDWPRQTVQTGFPLYDESDLHAIPDSLSCFLDEGPAPVLFAPGSAQTQGRDFFTQSAEACRKQGTRGLFVTRYPDQIPPDLPAWVRHFAYIPFSKVLPRCLAVVHHGGIGTTAQGLAAGIPHLVRPMAHDQQDNASRLERLGVGLTLPTDQYNAETAALSIQRFQADDAFRLRASALASKMAGANPLERTCDAIERLVRSG